MGEALIVNNNNDDTDRFILGGIEYCEARRRRMLTQYKESI